MTKNIAVKFDHNVDLTPFNTMGVSASAATFLNIHSVKQLFELSESGFFDREEPFVLGGGSNILLTSNLNRPVLKISIGGVDKKDLDDEHVLLRIGAGVNWHSLVTEAVEENYGGIENLALIPGTTGAAPIQNIGAYGVELVSVFHSLEFFHLKTGEFSTYGPDDCRFSYRNSIFKNELKGRGIVTGVNLKLKRKNHQPEYSYRSLRQYLDKKHIIEPGIRDIYEAVIAIRRSKLPNPEDIGNAGSFFKNPVIERNTYQELKKSYPELPGYEAGEDKIKVPAAWLIDQAGWKGKREGSVGTYDNQALVIVNHGQASGREILRFSRRIQESVRETFGIELVPEVNIVE